MREWILGIVSASLLSALALSLCPRGRVETVTRMVCGIICALAIASPILSLDPGSLAVGLAEYRRQARILAENEEEEKKMLERTYIEEECAAYICAKAAEIGETVAGAEVTASWDDEALLWYPWSAVVSGEYSARLSALIEGDLGIPASRQEWTNDG